MVLKDTQINGKQNFILHVICDIIVSLETPDILNKLGKYSRFCTLAEGLLVYNWCSAIY